MDVHASSAVRLAALLVVVGVLAGCGANATGPGAEGTPRADPTPRVPAGSPPTLSGAGGPPPPAWIETPAGSEWMAYGTYCWGACVRMVAPSQRDDVPRVRVQRGDEVAVRLGFDPAELSLSVSADGRREQVPVPARRDVTWRATRGGVVSLSARPDGGGRDASYHVRLEVAPAAP